MNPIDLSLFVCTYVYFLNEICVVYDFFKGRLMLSWELHDAFKGERDNAGQLFFLWQNLQFMWPV